MDLFPYGGFVFAILLTIAFLNTNMLVYKKEISESFLGGSDAGIYGESNELEQENSSNEYVRNDGNMQEPYTSFVNRKGKKYRVINNNN
jgi:hypothetical protein